MKLSQRRINFTKRATLLKLWIINETPWYPATDQVKRCSACKVGKKNSCHKAGLAEDILLYDKDLNYLNDEHPDTEKAYNQLHDKWDELGGSKRIEHDLNHFSDYYNGMR